MADVSLYLRDPYGSLLIPGVAYTWLDWALEENTFGVLRAGGPLAEINPDFLVEDARFEVRRSLMGAAAYVEGNAPFLLKLLKIDEDAQTWEVEAYTPEYILTNYIVDTYASTEEVTNPLATKTGAADDLAKEWITENLISPALSDRVPAMGLSVEGDEGAAASTTKSCSRDRVWDVLLDLAEDSAAQGTYMGYVVEYSGSGQDLIFRTYTTQRGVDHASSGAVEASKQKGNLRAARAETDWRNAVTCIRASGKGVGADRVTVRVESTARAGSGPYSYREGFHDDSRIESSAALTAAARSELERGRAKKIFTGEFVDTEYATYGRELNFGDTLIAKTSRDAFVCRLSRVQGHVEKETGEQLTISLEGTEAI